MAKKSNISKFPIVQEFLRTVGGEFAVGLVKICERKGSRVTDEEVAKKMRLKVTEVRTVLNRLHYRGIACYQKTKNKKTGWYSYTWSIKTSRVIELLLEEQKESIEKLEQTQGFEKTYTYFGCKNRCVSVPFEVAAEYQFKCPECSQTMEAVNTEKRLKNINRQIGMVKKEMEEMQKIL